MRKEKETETAQLVNLLREQYDVLDSQGVVAISTAMLAEVVCEIIDPSHESPMLMRFAGGLELRQLARGVCRKRFAMDELQSEQQSVFDFQLQPRYPVERDGDDWYVLREYLTLAERRNNIQRLRHEASAKSAHADALEAETDHLIRLGKIKAEV